MGKLSNEDKLRIQTLREQGLGAKAIRASYPDKNWSLSTLQTICRRVDETGSAVVRRVGSGRPKSARTAQKITEVGELICSQEDKPGTSKSSRQVATQLNISASSVRRIAKLDLKLSAFRRVSAQVLSDTVKGKRLARSKALLKRLTVERTKRVFFTDEKIFYLNPPVNHQNDRVWAKGGKKNVNTSRLLIERAKFAPHLMVSAGVCYGGKGQLHFVDEQAKVNASYYVTKLLPNLIQDCRHFLSDNFIFQQDGAPAHTAALAQDWIQKNCSDFIGKDEWPPNSPDLNPLDYHVWGAMLERYQRYTPKPTNTSELKTVLLAIWDDLPQEFIDKAILSFRKRLRSCVAAAGGHFEHSV